MQIQYDGILIAKNKQNQIKLKFCSILFLDYIANYLLISISVIFYWWSLYSVDNITYGKIYIKSTTSKIKFAQNFKNKIDNF